MDPLFSRSRPDWSDRAAVAEFAARGAEILGDDPAAARATAIPDVAAGEVAAAMLDLSVTCLEVFRPAELLNDVWLPLRSSAISARGEKDVG